MLVDGTGALLTGFPGCAPFAVASATVVAASLFEGTVEDLSDACTGTSDDTVPDPLPVMTAWLVVGLGVGLVGGLGR